MLLAYDPPSSSTAKYTRDSSDVRPRFTSSFCMWVVVQNFQQFHGYFYYTSGGSGNQGVNLDAFVLLGRQVLDKA